MTDWREFWNGREDAQHRQSDQEFLAKEAAEKLFHMTTGGRVMDFGCGAADMTALYAPHFDEIEAVDFSESMLAKARERIDADGITNVRLHHADDETVWDQVEGLFDIVTAGQVIQYLDDDQVRAFMAKARQRLNPGGRLLIFDAIDPRLFFLWRAGLFRWRDSPAKFALGASYRLSRMAGQRLLRRKLMIGRGYSPDRLIQMASDLGYTSSWCSSMYYEYRFHTFHTLNSDTLNS